MHLDCTKYTDEELVEKAITEVSFFECIMQRYEKKLQSYIFRLAKLDKPTAEDILQEVFLKIYKNLHAFQPKFKFSSWAYRITHNTTMTHLRKMQARPALYEFTEEENEVFFNSIESDFNLSQEFEKKEFVEKTREAIKKLPEKYYEVLVLRYLEDKNYQEISDILQKPIGTVSVLINRAKEKFKQIAMKEHLDNF